MKKGITFVFMLSLILGTPFENASAKTYWATGGGIGAAVGGIGAGVAAGIGCTHQTYEEDDMSGACAALLIPVGVIGGAAVGFGLGAAIGSAFKKKAPVVQAIIDPASGTYGAGVNMPF